jgi:phosphinothricin acetyltransferase
MVVQNPNEVFVRGAVPADSEAIARIYNHYVTQTVVTFEEEAISSSEIHRRIQENQSSLIWYVAEQEDEVVGYAYAGKWSCRSAYRFSTEVTAYVAPDHTGQGIGSRLYGKLLPALKDRDIHTVLGGIALPNEASVSFHEKFGFSKVAHFREVGFKFNRWIDVGYWQRIL